MGCIVIVKSGPNDAAKESAKHTKQADTEKENAVNPSQTRVDLFHTCISHFLAQFSPPTSFDHLEKASPYGSAAEVDIGGRSSAGVDGIAL